jgi:hypothetical protein
MAMQLARLQVSGILKRYLNHDQYNSAKNKSCHRACFESQLDQPALVSQNHGLDGFDSRDWLVAFHLGDANRAHVGEHLTQFASDVFKLFPKRSI